MPANSPTPNPSTAERIGRGANGAVGVSALLIKRKSPVTVDCLIRRSPSRCVRMM